MKLTTQLAAAAGGLALVVAASGAGGMAVADGLVKSSDIKDGTIKKVDLSDGVNDAINQVGATGPAGPAGPSGPSGAQGPAGVAGPSGLTGAFYAVAYYDVGNTNEGAVASVACDATGTDFTALAGGVQTLGLDDTPLDNNTPVSSSFPGRMDYSTNTPKPNRLDGWIVQFGGNAGTTPDRAPLRVKVWALCVPGSAVPVKQTYTQSQ